MKAFKNDMLPALCQRLSSIIIFLFSIFSLIAVVGSGTRDRYIAMGSTIPLNFFDYSKWLILVISFFFLILSYHLSVGSELAWELTQGLLLITLAVHLIRGHGIIEPIIVIVIMVMLLFAKDFYSIKKPFFSFISYIKSTIFAVIALLMYGVIGFWLLDKKHFGTTFSLKQAFFETVRIYTTFDTSNVIPKTRFGYIFLSSILTIGVITAIYLIVRFFMPVLDRFVTQPSNKQLFEKMIKNHSQDVLDIYKGEAGLKYYISENGKAAVAYTLKDSYMFVLGEPVGDRKYFGNLILSLSNYANANGTHLVFTQIGEHLAMDLLDYDFNILKIGEEAVISLNEFSLEGAAGKDFRYLLRRFEKLGYSISYYKKIHDHDVITELSEISDMWLKDGHQERKFTTSSFSEVYLTGKDVYVLRDNQNKPLAFISLIYYGKKCVALDFMRKRSKILNGSMEVLLITAMAEAKELGLKKFNLQLAALSGMDSAEKITEKTANLLYKKLDYIYNFEGLRKFKNKFSPEWQPKYLAIQSGSSTLFVIMSLLKIVR